MIKHNPNTKQLFKLQKATDTSPDADTIRETRDSLHENETSIADNEDTDEAKD